MTSDPPPPPSPPPPPPGGDELEIDEALRYAAESVMRVALSGFGGALVGLSLSRGGGAAAQSFQKKGASLLSASLKSSSAATNQRNIIRKNRPLQYVDRELPAAWAVACAAFAGIVEIARATSPTSLILGLVGGGNVNVNFGTTTAAAGEPSGGTVTLGEKTSAATLTTSSSAAAALTTVSDYILGGAAAGAMFRGSAIRTRAGARIDASLNVNTNMSKESSAGFQKRLLNKTGPKTRFTLNGLLPGAALGLLAGSAAVLMDAAEAEARRRYGTNVNTDNNGGVAARRMQRHPHIPPDVKAMSNDQLAKSIEELTRRTASQKRGES